MATMRPRGLRVSGKRNPLARPGLDGVLESGLEIVPVTGLIYSKQSMGVVKWVLAGAKLLQA